MSRSSKLVRNVVLAIGLTFAAAPVVVAQEQNRQVQEQRDGFDWGWLGLLGLLGLAGLSGRNKNDRDVRTSTADRTRP